MALDSEQLRRHRRERANRQKAARGRRRKVFLGLGAAVIIVAVCCVLIFSRKPEKEPAGSGKTTTIHFAAAGDLNITDGVVESGGSRYDYEKVFMDVAHLLADADVAALNFEGNVCGEPYGADSAPQSLLQALDAAGVDLLQLANSFSIHRGLYGLATTVDAIRASGMEPVGAYASQEEAAAGKGYVILNVKGIRIGVTAFTKGLNESATVPPNGVGCVNLLYKDYDSVYQEVDTEGISRVLDSLNREEPDIVIAMLHWGSPYVDTISNTQKKIISLMQEKGVDAIIGTHPHYVQQMVYDADKGTFLAYSLGDFYGGDAKKSGTEYSVILDLAITKNHDTGETKITGYSYTPIFTVRQDGLPVKVVRIKETMEAYEAGYIDRVSRETYDAMAYALDRIEARVTGK